MDIKKKTSGAFKRKQRQQREEMKQKLSKMDKFLTKTKCDISTVSTETENVDSSDDSNIMTTVSNEKLTTPTTKEPLVSELFKMFNDLGNFINKKLNDTEKRLNFDMGPLKPPGPFPKDPHQGNRSFSESYYIFQTKYGPVNRFSLCYSPLLDTTYCQPCWLFSLQRSTWCTGLRDWKHLSERIKEHGFSKNHIDKDLENQIRKEASFWRMVLQRLFDIIITLATNSLALRGHREDLSLEGYHGNFLSVVQLVSRYDQVLNQVLEMPKGNEMFLNFNHFN